MKVGIIMAKYKKRKDGRYATNVTVGRNWETGKPILVRVYGKTISELEKKKAELITDYASGRNIITKKVIFKDYAKMWLSNKKPHIAYATYLMYESVLKNHTKPIDDIELKSIIKSDIQLLINNKISIPRTCKKIKVALNQIFESAIDDNFLFRNPCKNIILPKYEANKNRILTRTEDILSDITELNDREQAYILLMKWCGLRPEECLALTKSNFDLENYTLEIRHAITFIHNKPIIKETKTKSGERIIPLIGKCKTFIPFYLSNLNQEYLFYSVKTNELITDSSYRRMWETIIRKMDKTAKEKGFTDFDHSLTPYIFRHNYATILHNLQVPDKEIQYLMGHSTIQTTNTWYIHIDSSNMKASRLLDNYITERQN